ncbi:restriction endonuclease subunit S [uncultured Streptococcus sp.]|uniref:restriction endonuclease subunit S n=1 Tax=uncultured Streptococcus sp. TaxID=83427 RepID=UPI0028DCFB43|nr:restriction endonuclease subunit S [uncultured Streptococcus sp.]
MDRKKNIPQIRFQNYEDEWVYSTIGRHISLLNGRAYKQEELLDEGKYRVLRVGNFNTNSKWYYSNLELEDNKYVNKGDLLYLWATNFGPEIWTEEKAIYHYHIWKLEFDKTDINQDYLYIWLESDKNKIQQNTNGSTMVHITKNMMEERRISLPSQDEQFAIGSLFRTLDDLLASYKDNLANYQSLKATMLSKMFPKAGQSVPEIRLAGFEVEWEKVKLKDVTESIEYGLNASAKEFDGENKYIRITDIDDVSRKFKEDSITSPDINVSECDNYLLCEKDILFARTGASVGKTYLYDIKDGKVYFAGFLIRARIKEKFDSKFIFQNTLTDRFTQYVKVTSQRSGQPGVNGKEYGEYELYLPKYEEQQAIGAYFSNLDNLIAAHQEKISQLETLKKKLLQDMFI